MPSDAILEGLYKSKLHVSVQLQTVLASYDQETVRNNVQTSYSRLRTSVTLHIDQTMRTRNSRVRNEIVVERSSHQESKGKERLRRKESGSVFIGKHMTMFERRLMQFK